MHLGLESMAVRGLSPLPSPGSGSRRGSRRCSVVDIITQPSCLTSASKSKSPKPSKKIFNRIGSEMVGHHSEAQVSLLNEHVFPFSIKHFPPNLLFPSVLFMT